MPRAKPSLRVDYRPSRLYRRLSIAVHTLAVVLVVLLPAQPTARGVALLLILFGVWWCLRGDRDMRRVSALRIANDRLFLVVDGQEVDVRLRELFLTRFLMVVSYRLAGDRKLWPNRQLPVFPDSVAPEDRRQLYILLQVLPLHRGDGDSADLI